MKLNKSRKLMLALACLWIVPILFMGCSSTEENNSKVCEGKLCSNHGTCKDVNGTPQCDCDDGYEVSTDKLSCTPTTGPCVGQTCSGYGECKDVNGTAECTCFEGYEPSQDKLTCLPVSGPCQGVTCSGHGTCTVVSNAAKCECTSPWIIDPGDPTKCITAGGGIGTPCTDNTQCDSGNCMKYPDPKAGYCSDNCTGPSDCDNKSGDGRAMCCVDLGGANKLCLKLGEGCTCGDQTGSCGTPCNCQYESACEVGLVCLGTICSHECTTGPGCNDCSDPNDQSTTFDCSEIFGGKTYCQAVQETTCENRTDCNFGTTGDVCVLVLVTEDDLSTMCDQQGEVATGEACDEEANPNDLPPAERCVGWSCMNGHCSEVCGMNTDCPVEEQVCGNITYCITQDAQGNCTKSETFGMCMWYDGSLTECKGSKDCSNSEVCDFYLEAETGTVKKICTTPNCDISKPSECSAPGTENCGADTAPPCLGGLCLVFTNGDSFCSELCETAADCAGTDMICSGLPLDDTHTTGVCIPNPYCYSYKDCRDAFEDPNFNAEYCLPSFIDDSGEYAKILGSCGRNKYSAKLQHGDDCTSGGSTADTRCGGAYCINSHCTEMCGGDEADPDADCQFDSGKCDTVIFCIDDQCTQFAEASMCSWFDGSLAPCKGDKDCVGTGEGGTDEICLDWVGPKGVANKACATPNCDITKPAECSPPGTVGCAEDTAPPCLGETCLNMDDGTSVCSTVCDVHADCPDNMVCGGLYITLSVVGGYCFPFESSKTPCIGDADCAATKEVCTYLPNPPSMEEGVAGMCTTPVANGADPGETCGDMTPCKNDLCIGNQETQEYYCSAVCATNSDCPETMECAWIGFGETLFASACVMKEEGRSPICSICDKDEECLIGSTEDEYDGTCGTAAPNVGKVKCGDAAEYVDKAKWCDGTNDCANGADEGKCDTCASNKFKCANSTCVSAVLLCNAADDCGDNSDENVAFCTAGCGAGKFQCSAKACVGNTVLCDGTNDCFDGSDEAACGTDTNAGKIKCGDAAEYVDKAKWCDGTNDCANSADEAGCTGCGTAKFECAAYPCIDTAQYCNGTNDCADGSDEANCTCPSSKFQCTEGICIDTALLCNGTNDCVMFGACVHSAAYEGETYCSIRCPGGTTTECTDVLEGTTCDNMQCRLDGDTCYPPNLP